MKPDNIERFNSKLTKLDNGCWLYNGATNEKGYGKFNVLQSNGKYKMELAHRFAFVNFRNEVIEKNERISQSCGVRSCCSPDHLVKTNMKEVTKKSWISGARDNQENSCQEGILNRNVKLNEEQVLEIRTAINESNRELAIRFNISETQVSRIRNNERWQSLWR